MKRFCSIVIAFVMLFVFTVPDLTVNAETTPRKRSDIAASDASKLITDFKTAENVVYEIYYSQNHDFYYAAVKEFNQFNRNKDDYYEIPEYITYQGNTIPVIEIDSGAFYTYPCSTVVIPDTVLCIDDGMEGYGGAFTFSEIERIKIPESVQYIGKSAFGACDNLNCIEIYNPECEIYDDPYTIYNTSANGRYTGIIYGYEKSTAHDYAKKYGYDFVSFESLDTVPNNEIENNIDELAVEPSPSPTPASPTSIPTSEPQYPAEGIRGDVDLDGKVTQVDATILLRECLSLDMAGNTILEEVISDEGKQRHPDNYIEMSHRNGDVDYSNNGSEFQQTDATYILRVLLEADINSQGSITDEVWKTIIQSDNKDNNDTNIYNNENETVEIRKSDEYKEVGAGSESSRQILMSYLPELYCELSSDKSILFEDERFDKNTFSICDIDSDGEAELLVKIMTGPMAAKALYIYKADSSGNVVLESAMNTESVFYENGLVQNPISHNQGRGSLWPYGVLKYDPSEDTYTAHSSIDSWDKSLYAEGFPDEIDTSGTGVVYYIYDADTGKTNTCDYTDYVKWFNSWNQCSPMLKIDFESFSEDNVRKYNSNWSGIRPSLDIDDSVTASYNSDGTIKIEYSAVPMTLTLPASWAGKFVVRNGCFYSKESYYINDYYDGKLLTLVFRDEYGNSGGPARYIGKAGNKYCYYYRVTDVRYNMNNKAEVNAYESLYADVENVIRSIVCVPYENKSSAGIVNLNPYLRGEISSGGLSIEGYTTAYVCNGAARSVQWYCEDTWHITARRRTSSYGVTWYECWDTDDGDYYGWIDGKFLYFYS